MCGAVPYDKHRIETVTRFPTPTAVSESSLQEPTVNNSAAIARTAAHMTVPAARAPRTSDLSFFDRVEVALGIWRQRRSLARLDRTLLEDIGLSAEQADREAARPIWDVPALWRR